MLSYNIILNLLSLFVKIKISIYFYLCNKFNMYHITYI